jgi:hypothetical protein
MSTSTFTQVTANLILVLSQDSSNDLTLTPIANSGSNTNGGTLTLTSGVSTGTGTSIITFQTAPVGSSGSTANTLSERMRIDSIGNVAIGTTSTASYRLSVVQAGSAQAYLASTGSNNSQIYMDNQAGGQTDSLIFLDAGSQKWELSKTSTNQFILYDIAGAKTFINANSGANLTLGAGQNTYIDQTGNLTVGVSGGTTAQINTNATALHPNFDGTGTSASIAQAGTLAMPGGNGGMVLISDNSNGDVGMFFFGGGGVSLVSSLEGSFIAGTSGTSPPSNITSGHSGLYFNSTAGQYTFYNNRGSTITFYFTMFRVRPST